MAISNSKNELTDLAFCSYASHGVKAWLASRIWTLLQVAHAVCSAPRIVQ
jgi:hypothetical protein